MKKYSNITIVLIIIVLAASAIRLYDLPRGDVVSDEVLYGFRAIGYLDFDFAIAQPSTLQLFDGDIPAWTKLSFHDHPPLVFLVQHWFINLIGSNNLGMRLPSALFGIATVLLMYFIGKRLFSERAGVIAAGLMAMNVLMVYVSRTGVQEAQVLFFEMLTAYLFLRAREDPRWFLATGAAFGLALLSKYTAAFLVIPLIVYLLLSRRDVFRKWHVYGGIVLALLIFSPVIIYNILLFKTFAHFDFQLSYIFGQDVSYWQVTPGKEIGSLLERLSGIGTNLWFFNSLVFNIFTSITLVATGLYLIRWKRRERKEREAIVLILIGIASLLLMYAFIGPAARFLAMLIPWLSLLVAFGLSAITTHLRRSIRIAFYFFIAAIIAWEGLFAINSYVLERPIGEEVVHYSRIHWDAHTWGFNVLDEYLETMLAGSYPVQTTGYTLPWLNNIRRIAIQRGIDQGRKPLSVLFVYNDNAANLAMLWAVSRRALYEGWAMMPIESYQRTLDEEGENFFRSQGFEKFFFIQNTDAILLNQPERITSAGDLFEATLSGIDPHELTNHDGQVVFRIYEFE